MERVTDFLFGCALMRAVGAEPEKLFTKLAEEKIIFWDAVPEDACTVSFRVGRKDAEKVIGLSSRCCCDAAVVRRTGLPEDFQKLKRRRVLLVLPAVLFALLLWSSFYVWRIEIDGNETVPDTEILNALEESGVSIGSFWPAFTSDNIRSEVLVKIPELKWLSVSVYGSRAHVVVRERTKAVEPVDEKKPVKLVAAAPGVIDKMEILCGLAKFQKGQAALAGETLADGAVPDMIGGVRFVHAEGSVMAETYEELMAEMPLTALQKTPSGHARTHLALLFGEKRINFYAGSRIFDTNCDTIIKVHKLGIEGLFELPVSIITETEQPYQTTEAGRQEDAMKARLQKQLETELARRVGETGKTESAETTFAVINGYEVASLRAVCRRNIAKEVPMTQEEITEAQNAQTPKEANKTE